jgi:hypothetical protein
MLFRLLESLHGHLGVLAAIGLVHPAILLRRGHPLSRGGRWSIALTALATALAFGSGAFIYPAYIRLVRRHVFSTSVPAGMLFETKEHLAFVVTCLTAGAAVAALCSPREEAAMRRAAALLFAAAALLCLLTAGLGSYVAAVRGFWS